jgi:hypothetical protein
VILDGGPRPSFQLTPGLSVHFSYISNRTRRHFIIGIFVPSFQDILACFFDCAPTPCRQLPRLLLCLSACSGSMVRKLALWTQCSS